MIISCPRCNENVLANENHCNKCGFSIKNYIANKKINICVKDEIINNDAESKDVDNACLSECTKENNVEQAESTGNKKRSTEDIEDSIIRFISNIKIVKDTKHELEDDEIDSGVHAFLVEALNDTFKQKETITINPVEESKTSISETNVSVIKEKDKDEKVKDKEIIDHDLKLQEPEEKQKEENLVLEDIFPVEEIGIKKDTKEDIKKDINESKILAVGNKIIDDSKEYEKFYAIIDNLRQNKMNNKVIAMVTGTIVLVFIVVLLLTGVVTANDIH